MLLVTTFVIRCEIHRFNVVMLVMELFGVERLHA